MTVDRQLDFESRPESGPKDETDYSLRAYVAHPGGEAGNL